MQPRAFAYVEKYSFYDKVAENYRLSETRFITQHDLACRRIKFDVPAKGLGFGKYKDFNDYDAFEGWIKLLKMEGIFSPGIKIEVTENRLPFFKRSRYAKGTMLIERIPLSEYRPGPVV